MNVSPVELEPAKKDPALTEPHFNLRPQTDNEKHMLEAFVDRTIKCERQRDLIYKFTIAREPVQAATPSDVVLHHDHPMPTAKAVKHLDTSNAPAETDN
jgi:hypothetical protein